ncbi:RNA polymerase sigma factor [Chitinophaga sp. RCC_12]|uniref:RNA polymerase sigma factor n=1 Tax=Chitinophaga sp. RCC_12 TaxID=3239226 RepID=UPI0035264D66
MPNIHVTDSTLLWQRYLSGDAKALENILRLHYNLLYKYGKQFTPDTEAVKDCIQDLFLFLWKNRTAINETPAVANYLVKSLRNRLRRHLSAKKLVLGSEDDFSFNMLPDQAASSEAKLVLQEESQTLAIKIQRSIASLSRRQQEIIYLKFYLNANTKEISEIMGIGRQSIYNLLNEAIKKLGNNDKKHFYDALSIAVIATFSEIVK